MFGFFFFLAARPALMRPPVYFRELFFAGLEADLTSVSRGEFEVFKAKWSLYVPPI
jgi:hypothetical protein